ncbi:hypothetical protein BJ742DRAFT_906489 [Cladochytrium replicatum]|nr:hypothetical protein BJ742DRAFT_906489 [Cladochytrium replicatum]
MTFENTIVSAAGLTKPFRQHKAVSADTPASRGHSATPIGTTAPTVAAADYFRLAAITAAKYSHQSFNRLDSEKVRPVAKDYDDCDDTDEDAASDMVGDFYDDVDDYAAFLLPNQSLSEEEYRSRGSEVLRALHEKNRDLRVAAQIGQSLLTANAALKKAYEDLLAAKGCTLPGDLVTADQVLRNALYHVNPFEAHGDSDYDETFEEDEGDKQTPTLNFRPNFAQAEHVEGGAPASVLMGAQDIMSQLSVHVPSSDRNVMESLPSGLHVVDYISSLEKTNADQQAQLSRLLEQDANNVRAIRKLEAELEEARNEAGSLGSQLTELEQEKRRLLRDMVDRLKEKSQTEVDDQKIIEELELRIKKLEQDYAKTVRERKQYGMQLEGALSELAAFRKKCSELEEQLEGTEYLRHLYDQQSQYIDELKAVIEDHRNIIASHMSPGAGYGDDFGLMSPADSTKTLMEEGVLEQRLGFSDARSGDAASVLSFGPSRRTTIRRDGASHIIIDPAPQPRQGRRLSTGSMPSQSMGPQQWARALPPERDLSHQADWAAKLLQSGRLLGHVSGPHGSASGPGGVVRPLLGLRGGQQVFTPSPLRSAVNPASRRNSEVPDLSREDDTQSVDGFDTMSVAGAPARHTHEIYGRYIPSATRPGTPHHYAGALNIQQRTATITGTGVSPGSPAGEPSLMDLGRSRSRNAVTNVSAGAGGGLRKVIDGFYSLLYTVSSAPEGEDDTRSMITAPPTNQFGTRRRTLKRASFKHELGTVSGSTAPNIPVVGGLVGIPPGTPTMRFGAGTPNMMPGPAAVAPAGTATPPPAPITTNTPPRPLDHANHRP